MGLSSKTSKSSNKPIYGAAIEGAANDVTSAYRAQQPKITGITDQLGSVVPGLLEKYTQGDPTVNEAVSYNSDVLSGKYLDAGNPYLSEMIDITGDKVRNGVQAAAGTRGLTGGSSYYDLVSRALAENATNLQFNNYNTERGRMDSAAAMAPQLAASRYLPLNAAQGVAQSQFMPLQAAGMAGQAVGGLLGQYTNRRETYQPSALDSIGQALKIGSTIAGFG